MVLFLLVSVRAHGQRVDAESSSEARTLFVQAEGAYKAGRLNEARDKLERANRLAPRPEFEFDLGRICERMGDGDAAIVHFRAYLTSELSAGERADVEKRVARLLGLREKKTEPIQVPTTSALTGEGRRFFERGRKFFHHGRYEAAAAAFAAAKRYTPAPELDYNLAVVSERLERPKDAVDYYRAYLHEAKDAPDAVEVQARIAALMEARRPSRITDRSPRPAALQGHAPRSAKPLR